jgi:3-oxoacyl-[acyl-carrier protein] reductase
VADAEAAGRRAAAWPLALEDVGATAAFVAEVVERFGAVHTLVHAAGLYVDQLHMSRVTPEQYRRHLLGEASGFFNIVHPLLPSLRAQRGPIVAVSTMATRRFPIKDGLSSSPKGAVEALVRALAAEEGRFGVRANCVGPGVLSDGMAGLFAENGEMDEQALTAARSRVPLQRFGTAGDIAEAVCFLASPRSSYITGQMLDVDGGYSV